MNFKPLGDLVLIQLDLGGEETTEQGIIYEKTIESYVWCKVIAIGDGKPATKTGKNIPCEFKVGEEVLVLFRTMKGTHTEGLYSGEERVYHIFDRKDVICAKEK